MWNSPSAIKKLVGLLLLGVIYIGLYHYFKFKEISSMPFGSIHAWRQADCLSIADQMYDGNANLLYPKTHYVKQDMTQLSAGEFPLVNWLASFSFRVFGYDLAHYRMIVFIFFVFFAYSLYILFYYYSGSLSISILGTVIISSSPILVYYSFNFLPDVPALSLASMGLCFILTSSHNNKISLYTGIGLLAIASLLKLTFIILLMVWVVLAIYKFIRLKDKFDLIQLVIISGLSVLIIICWYVHAFKLDHNHPPFIFLTETRSWWDASSEEKNMVWDSIRKNWLPIFYLKIFLFGFTASIIISIWKLFHTNKTLVSGFLLMTLGYVVIFLLLFKQFKLHDYLLIGFIPVFIVGFLLILGFIKSHHLGSLKSALKLFLFGICVMQLYQAKLILIDRYFKFDRNLVYNQDLLSFRNIKTKAGIQESDLVISIPDPSPNISLVAMDQPGFTNYRESNRDLEDILDLAVKGAKFLVISDEKELRMEYLKPIHPCYVFHYKSIVVYDLQKALKTLPRNRILRMN